MNNPYKPPETHVISNEEKQRYYPPVGWKFYFWFNIVMLSLMIILYVISLGFQLNLISLNALDMLDFIIWSASIPAIFGLAWSRQILSKTHWKIYTAVFVVWYFAYGIIAGFVLQITQYGEIKQPVDLLYDLPFFFLTLLALYRYTNSMKFLWSK